MFKNDLIVVNLYNYCSVRNGKLYDPDIQYAIKLIKALEGLNFGKSVLSKVPK